MMGFQAGGLIKSTGVLKEVVVPPADLMAEITKGGIQDTVRWAKRIMGVWVCKRTQTLFIFSANRE